MGRTVVGTREDEAIMQTCHMRMVDFIVEFVIIGP
jgi:hypothetical protein